MSMKNRAARIDEEIERNLKRAFDKLASEPVPDKFNDLLQQLRMSEATSKGAGEEGSNAE
ncbi:NepR family anti-sigma factor [Poseidonocella pacifica]|uniref:NepR family anti-sigma factor n=1 Tax=Poseidonocella pacifica TaxID=871651 RepID=UPI0011138E28|nr:NepR family anti-sigma factor [Poseidonocella pacifica]